MLHHPGWGHRGPQRSGSIDLRNGNPKPWQIFFAENLLPRLGGKAMIINLTNMIIVR